MHGAPLHIGLPQQIGITDLQHPWQGDAVPVAGDELPLFWACGITPQSAAEAAVQSAKLPLFIAHTPGHMLVTDQLNSSLAVI